jgi:regulator of sirC expression with transglutaminase-like and TPR domain
MTIARPDELLERLRKLGEAADDTLPLAETALLLAGLDHIGVDLAPYHEHLARMAADARDNVAALRRGMAANEAAARVLVDTISGRHGYMGDSATYDDPRNADLIAVIDRRRGLPVALGVIYLDVAAAIGVKADGLNTQGHFLMSVGEGEHARIVDPFNGVVLDAHELRLAPPMAAAQPEYGPVSRRDVLLRLLNNIHARAMAGKDAVRTLTVTERMVLIAPRRADLWLELCKANEAVGKLNGAISAAQSCIALSGADNSAGREAAFMLHRLKRKVN